MPKYVLTYHGDMSNMPTDPAAIEQVMQAWGAWYETIGEGVVDNGAPFGHTTAVAPDGSSTDAPAKLSGYTIVNAADMAAATTIAQGCPVLGDGHTVQISEAIDM